MEELIICGYWKNRPSTLRDYAISVVKFIRELSELNSHFQPLYWIGDKPNEKIAITNNAEKLIELIHRHAGGNDQVYDVANPDGSPKPASKGWRGFGSVFNNGTSSRSGGITISIRAGKNDINTWNAVTIALPASQTTSIDGSNCFDYESLKNVFLKIIVEWKIDKGLIFTESFSDIIYPDGITDVGLLTYIKNSNANAMRNNPDLIAAGIEMEPVSIGGTLFCIDREMVSPDNETQVARAKLLRTKLMENHLIES